VHIQIKTRIYTERNFFIKFKGGFRKLVKGRVYCLLRGYVQFERVRVDGNDDEDPEV
jgi:hypothetical protein